MVLAKRLSGILVRLLSERFLQGNEKWCKKIRLIIKRGILACTMLTQQIDREAGAGQNGITLYTCLTL